MRKLRTSVLKTMMFLIIVLFIYFAGVLTINTLLDFQPRDRSLELPGISVIENDTAQNTFSMVIWNIGYGGLGKDVDFFYDGGKMVKPSRKQAEKYFNEILGAISSFNDPDFILFQEVDLASARSYHRNQYEEIALRLGSYAGFFVPNYDVFFVPLPILRPMGKVSSGLALFSSREPDAAEMHAFPGNYAWPKKLFMPDRCFISMAIDLNNGRHLHVINTHNSAFDDGSLRNEQLGILFKHMETLYARGDYVIAGGDWNINPPGFEAGYFASGDKGFNVPFETTVFDRYAHWHIVYDEAFPTNRDVSMPYSPGICNTTILDFYVCSPNISILGINTLYDGFQNTDHQPVLIRFALGPP